MTAQAARRASEPVEFRLDRKIPRLFVTIDERATGPGVAEALSTLYLEQPEITRLDILFQLNGYRGVVTHEDLTTIVKAYLTSNSDPAHPCRSAFVTPDPHFHLWAAAMSYLFTGREHRVFVDHESASAWLDEPMAERPQFTGDPVPGLENAAA